MKKEIQIFNNEQFGRVRTIEQEGKVYFCGKDVAEALGYRDTVNALKQHCRVAGVVKHHLGVQTGKKSDGTPAYQNVRAKFIDEGNIYRLIINSKLPSAEQFETWVFDEVLPTLRKAGSYAIKNDEKTRQLAIKEQNAATRKENANIRKAQLLYKVGESCGIESYKQVIDSHVTYLLTGQALLPLPEANKQTYSAGEIGTLLGISANKVGKIANEHNLKTDEFGVYVWDKSPYSAHQCQTFRYYINIISVLKKLLEAA